MSIANIVPPCMVRTQMFSLTLREQSLIAAILLAAISGRLIQHLRTRSDNVTVPVNTARISPEPAPK